MVDADVARQFWPFSFTVGGRMDNVFNLQALACFLATEGYNVAVSAISPFKLQRDTFKKENPGQVLEVYLYGRGGWNEEKYGEDRYEPPTEDFVGIDMGKVTVQEAVRKVLEAVKNG